MHTHSHTLPLLHTPQSCTRNQHYCSHSITQPIHGRKSLRARTCSCTCHTHTREALQTHTHDHIHRSKPLGSLSHVPRVPSHRRDPPAMFDWFFEAACPASLQEGELGASGGSGNLEDGPGALNLEARSPTDPPILRQFPPDFRDQVCRLALCSPGPGPVLPGKETVLARGGVQPGWSSRVCFSPSPGSYADGA